MDAIIGIVHFTVCGDVVSTGMGLGALICIPILQIADIPIVFAKEE